MSQETQAFSCKMCGHCCKGKGGIVVSPSDLKRLCTTLRMEEEEVIRQFPRGRSRLLHLLPGRQRLHRP